MVHAPVRNVPCGQDMTARHALHSGPNPTWFETAAASKWPNTHVQSVRLVEPGAEVELGGQGLAAVPGSVW